MVIGHRVRCLAVRRDDEIDQPRTGQAYGQGSQVDLVEPRVRPLRPGVGDRNTHASDGRGHRSGMANTGAVEHEVDLVAGSTEADWVRGEGVAGAEHGRVYHRLAAVRMRVDHLSGVRALPRYARRGVCYIDRRSQRAASGRSDGHFGPARGGAARGPGS